MGNESEFLTGIDIDNKNNCKIETKIRKDSAQCTLPFVGCCIFHSDLLGWKLEYQIYIIVVHYSSYLE